MNEARKEKLKNIILKLPFGLQLLRLRRKVVLKREEKELMKAYNRILKQSKIKQLQDNRGAQQERKFQSIDEESKREVQRIRETIRQSEISIQLKNKLFFEARLRSFRYYYQRSTENAEIFRTYCQLPPEQVTVFEIGAGPALGAAIGMSLIGFKKVITVDIHRARPKHVQMAYEHYKKFAGELGIKHVPKIKGKITAKNLDPILLEKFNIDYRAPYDAAHTNLPDDSVGYVYANLVLNYISVEILTDMIKEVFRILHGGGGDVC